MKGTITKKVIVLITLISFTITCTGCYSYCDGERNPSTVEHTGERRTAVHRTYVDLELLTGLLVFVVLIASIVTGHSHGHYSGGHSYHH